MRKYSLSDVYSNKNEMSIAQLFKKRINIAVILSGFCYLLLFFFYSCNEPDTMQFGELGYSDIELTASEASSKRSLDSAKIAESIDYSNQFLGEIGDAAAAPLTLSSNYALEAVVSAESTYPGYSVQKIRDGSRNTTVGPSYSWANNYPAGGRLPESVFLKFSSLKKVDRIDIYTSTGYALKDYTIQYRTSTTGAWTNIIVVTNNTSVYRSHTFTAVNLLEVQIICQLGPTHQAGYGRLNEVEIYGPVPTLPSISVENGMLVFSSEADVEQAIEYLEYKYEQYTKAFVSQYSHLTDDQLADIEDATGFNDQQPYIDFENLYGIFSLRYTLSIAEENWLANTAGDSTAGTDPDDLYMDDDELETLVNTNGELKVGSTYYVFLSDGSYYTYDGDPYLIENVRNLNPSEPLPENVIYNSSLVAGDCRRVVKNRDFIENVDKSWRFKYKVKFWDGPFGGCGHTKAVTKSYKKKSNGHWKVHSASVAAQVYGNLGTLFCYIGPPIDSGLETERGRKVKAKVYHCNAKAINGGIKSFHYHGKVGSYTHTLKW